MKLPHLWQTVLLLAALAMGVSPLYAQTRAQILTPLRPELVVQTVHSGAVYSVAFSPDGRVLASGSMDRTVKLWDVATGLELRTLANPTASVLGYVSSVSFSPNGRTLASGTMDGTVYLWDVADGKELRAFSGHTADVNSVAFSPDGLSIASGGADREVKLWDVATGREVRTLAGHTAVVTSVAFTPDGGAVVSASVDSTVKVWDVATGKENLTLVGHADSVASVAISRDGRTLASGSHDNTVKLWDLASGKELRTLAGHSYWVNSVAFSPDGRMLASASLDDTIRLWDVATGKKLRTLESKFTAPLLCVAFSPDGRTLASGSSLYSVNLWSVSTGKELQTLLSPTTGISSVAASADGRTLASGGVGGKIELWDLATRRGFRILSGHTGWVRAVSFGPDGRTLATGSDDKTVKLWDPATGRQLLTLVGHSDDVTSVAFSPDGRMLASGSQDKTIKLWDTGTGRELRTLAGHSSKVNSVSFSPDGRTLASGSEDKTIKLWDVSTGEEIRTLASSADSIFGEVASVAISPDGRILAAGKDDHTVTLWDIATGHQIRTMTGHTFSVNSVTFSPDGRQLASAGSDATVKLWDISTGQELRTFAGHTSSFNSVSFTSDGLTIFSGSSDGSIYFWNAESGGELARLVALQEIDWAVVDPQGRFDASPGGMQSLHWVAGMEIIALDQLKERYFDPGLLGKILRFNPEPLRNVSAFSSVTLYPDVKVLGPVDASGKLHIQLKNRGGGIGRIQVFVNGKELLADARGPRPDPSASESTLSLDLRNVPVLPGTENEIRIVPWNQEGYISGRGVKTIWTPEGASNDRPPEFYAIIAGISRYQSPDIQLGFSAKDAEDMAHALDLGAGRLFGPDHIHITILSTTGNPGVLSPTKANLQKAFEAARRAQPGDVLVVYLAGHGLAVHDLYAYPTEEARSLDLSDPEIRRQTAVTSEELVEWIKKIPARHQVMILDTCAAGAAALKFVEKREVPGDQIRALDRLKDRTGFFVLMGSAADSVSYEASQYGQGLLTYSLLQGMRGAALKNDVEVDVSSLFEFAADRVPLLARDIGGIQKPQILPGTGGSFDVGLLKKEDKENIPLAPAKPMILRPVFINTRLHRDDLGLNAAIRKHLREETYASERGAAGSSAAIFFDQEDFPGAISPSGDYSVEGKSVKVTVVLTRNDKELTQLTVEGPLEDPDALADKIVRFILAAITSAHVSP